MFKNKPLRVVMILGILLSLGVGSPILYTECTKYYAIQGFNELQRDFVLPVVRIRVEIEFKGKKASGFGSGVVVYSQPNELGTGYDTYVLTCNHVVETPIFDESKPVNLFLGPEIKGFNHEVLYVELFDKWGNTIRRVPARVIAYSPNVIPVRDSSGNLSIDHDAIDPVTKHPSGEDLALLKLDALEPFPTCKMPTRETLKNLRVFNKVRVVGCALADKPIPTLGEITRTDWDFLSISAPIIFGNSGGPCYLEDTHELIGLANMIAGSGSSPVTHMGYVRPLLRAYNWFDTIGYKFIYDKSVSDAERYAIIRYDMDQQRLIRQEHEKALERNLKTFEKAIEEMSKGLKDKTSLIDALTNKIADLEKEIQSLCEGDGRNSALIEKLQNDLKNLQKQLEELRSEVNTY